MGLKHNCLVTLILTEFSSETGTEKRVIKFTFFWTNSRTISRPIRFTKSKTKKINGTAWRFFTRYANFRPNFHFRASLLHPSCNFRFFSVIHYVRPCPGIWMHKETNFIKYRVCLTVRHPTWRRRPAAGSTTTINGGKAFSYYIFVLEQAVSSEQCLQGTY